MNSNSTVVINTFKQNLLPTDKSTKLKAQTNFFIQTQTIINTTSKSSSSDVLSQRIQIYPSIADKHQKKMKETRVHCDNANQLNVLHQTEHVDAANNEIDDEKLSKQTSAKDTPTGISSDGNGNENKKTSVKPQSKHDLKYAAFKYVTSFKIFPIQDLAFKSVDSLQAQIKAKQERSPDWQKEGACDKDPTEEDILWSKEPRLFALEYNNEGKRKYVSSHMGRFINYYWGECKPKDRNYYELIREKTPCRLYFDIEYNRNANPGISEEVNELLLEEFISELATELKTRFDLSIGRKHIVDLDSSTAKKFSRHFIFHFPEKELFADAVACGVFVKSFIGRLAEEVATGEMAQKGKTALHKHLFLFTKEISEKDGTNRPKTCFVDTGVYTRNRIFRIIGSKKYGKPQSAALRIASTNEFPFPANFHNGLFYNQDNGVDDNDNSKEVSESSLSQERDWNAHARALVDTLIIPIEEDRIDKRILGEIKEDANRNQIIKILAGSSTSSKPRANRMLKTGATSSPFPALDNFVRKKLANRKGINGSVRTWSMENDNLSSSLITYQIKDNRWCENIQRSHKSNNVMWHISISDLKYWQTCHDPDCRLSSFRGEWKDLPPDVCGEISSILSDKEDEVNESFERALLELNLSDSPTCINENTRSKKQGKQLESSNEKNIQNNDSLDADFDVDDSFEMALLKFDIPNGTSKNVTNKNGHAIKKTQAVPDDFDVDEDFEKALMNLKI